MKAIRALLAAAFFSIALTPALVAQTAPTAPTAPVTESAQPSASVIPGLILVKPQGVTVDGGGIIGSIIQWVAVVLGTPLSILAAAWLKRAFTAAGVDINDKLLAKFQSQIANGVALAAHEAQADLTGKLQLQVKDQIAARTLQYVQEHGAETAKDLGFDPSDPKFIEAVQARALKVMSDVAAPPAAAAIAAVDVKPAA